MTDTAIPYYPDWLAQGLLAGTLPWNVAQPTTMAQFLTEYTLHDSYWITLWMVPYTEAIAVLRWDTFWSRERVPYPSSAVALWPILLIRFARLYRVTTVYRLKTQEFVDIGIAGAETHLVADQTDPRAYGLNLSLTNWPDITPVAPQVDWPLQATLIHGDAILELLHDTKVDLLCLDRNGTVIPIPDL